MDLDKEKQAFADYTGVATDADWTGSHIHDFVIWMAAKRDAIWRNENWREAVYDACTVAHIGWDADDPRTTLARLIDWHVQVALDPAVSKPMRDLIDERDLFKHGHRVASDNCVRLEGELAHWKANHADMVKRAALLAERPDLPVDRIPAYRELVRLQEEATRRAAEDEDDIASIMVFTRLMVGVANALKGQPEPLHQHSWHDLPHLARRLMRKYAVLQGRNRQLSDQLANTRMAPMCERKTGIIERDGYVKTGYVLRCPGADREVCVSDGGAVSWFTLEQWNWLLFNRDHVEFDWPKPLSVRYPHPKPTTEGEPPA